MNFETNLDKAAKFAGKFHTGQIRKSTGIPYVSHCFDVMKQVAEYGAQADKILSAALLHDLIEDCDIDKHEIGFTFGIDIAQIVEHCSRTPTLNSKKQKLDWLRGFENKTIESIVIKIADRYCNVTDYIRAGNSKYAMWYNLQAYPLYSTYFKREHEVPQEWRSGIRSDIYAYNQKMELLLGHSLKYLETEHFEDTFFNFDRKAVDGLLIRGVK